MNLFIKRCFALLNMTFRTDFIIIKNMIINTGARTDTVQYYSEWLLERFKKGFVFVRNPLFPEKITRYELKPNLVDCVIFCSKNYEPILPRLNEITNKFNTYFFYTITAYGKDLEQNVPDIDKSIDTLLKLEKIVGKEKICWRYDPVFLTKKYTIQQHLITFEHMAVRLSGHISRCVFSFVEMYKKLEENFSELQELKSQEKDELAFEMSKIAHKHKIILQTCATKENFENYGILKSGCVTLDILSKANGNLNFKNLKHQGMRKNCNCIISHDIGAYNTCPNGCKYCYANQNPEIAKKNYEECKKNIHSPILLGKISDSDIISFANQKSYLVEKNLQLELF